MTMWMTIALVTLAQLMEVVDNINQNGFHVNCDAMDDADAVGQNDEFRLFNTLMKHYDRDVRPVKNASQPVVVRLGITLTQIFDLDEKNQVLTTSVWLDMEWLDGFLTWDPADYGNITSIRVPCERIWLPDVVLYNNADDFNQGFMKSKAMITPDGNVFWPPPTKMRSLCPVDVTYFPFDHQTCVLKLGSWIYDGFQVDVTNRSMEVDMSNYVPNGEWELVTTKVKRNVVYYSCCPEPFPDVTITIVIRRRTLYYVSNVVLPCMMMSALTLLVFRLPPDAGEKIALGFTVLLAFSVFMLTTAEKMPETSTSVPLIGMYLTAVMAITTISIMMTVVVLNFHYRGPSKDAAPKWLRRLLLGKMGARFCADIVNSSSGQSRPSSKSSNLASAADPWISVVDHETKVTKDIGRRPRTHSKSSSCSGRINNSVDGHCETQTWKLHRKEFEDSCVCSQEIVRLLRSMADKDEQERARTDIINEWRQMAVVVDRLLFWVFLVAMVVSSFVFLVVVPSFRQDNVWLSGNDPSLAK